jgi:Cu(I)/Ag(I) efflux system membrane protein CusA/SilA
MIEKCVDYSVRNPLVVVIVAIGVALWGVYATWHTPVDAIPDLSENQVIVFADWPGRNPKDVEDQITYPLSVNLQGLAGVKSIRAISEFGYSMVSIIFDDDVEFYFARQRVLERLSIANTFLPAGVAAYLAPDTTALGQIYWYTVEGAGYDLGRLRAIQDWYVRYQLYSVPGVAEVASVGGLPIEYQVDVDPNKLRSYNVSLGELYTAVRSSNASVGGRVIQKGSSEYLVRSTGWIQSLEDVEQTVIKSVAGTPVRVGDVATVQFGAAQRRNVLEKDGNEAVGGVVLMRYGENPLVVTERIKEKVAQLQAGLPDGVRIVPFYDRTRLIHEAIDTVGEALIQESLVASLVIALVMWHLRSTLIVCLMLPLSALIAFILMRQLGISSNIMSLSGIAISIGVLVDAAIVMVDQGAHTLHGHFGAARVRGDTRELLLPALSSVGRPIFFSLAIMIISFLPVFALSGMEGKMFRPLAFTKSFALVGVSVLAVTLVPALIPWLLRGRIRHEEDNWLVRRVMEIYRPVLAFVMQHPWPVVWIVSAVYVLGAVPSGSPWLFRAALGAGLVTNLWASWGEEAAFRRHWRWVAALWFLGIAAAAALAWGSGWRPAWWLDDAGAMRWIRAAGATAAAALACVMVVAVLSRLRYAASLTTAGGLVVIGLLANQWMVPLGREFMPPLDEGAILDMPVTVPRVSVTQVSDDLKARNAVMRAFPEVELVVGKAGRAETPTDPAPLDMVETVINLRPRTDWPKRHLRYDDAVAQTRRAWSLLRERGWLAQASAAEPDEGLVNDATMLAIQDFDGLMRSIAAREWGAFAARQDAQEPDEERRSFVRQLNGQLHEQARWVYTHHVLSRLREQSQQRGQWEGEPTEAQWQEAVRAAVALWHERLLLWAKSKDELLQELDAVVQMPGWGNIWTQPIINRIDMLATGVNTMVGVRVFGDDHGRIAAVCQEIAEVLRGVRGAVDVSADQVVGEGYLEIDIDRQRAARYGVTIADIQDVIETALGGQVITMTVEGRERFPVRVRYARAFREDEEWVRSVLVNASAAAGADLLAASTADTGEAADASDGSGAVPGMLQVPLAQVADVRIVEGPSMIRSENGMLRSYVRLNVRDRDLVGFVTEAQQVVADNIRLPAGMYLEWAGQFEHELRARRTLMIVVPIVVVVIFLLLFVTYHDFADTLVVMLLAVPGAVFGGVLLQYLFGYNFSVAVMVGFIACFGLATEGGLVILVYLREAIAARGGLERMTLAEVKQAVMDGAVHRTRPKLMTELTTLIGLAPMLWATGTGAEIMRPMAAPVLGGILVSDEVIDLLLPVFFYRVRAWRWKRLHARQDASELETG